MQLPPDPESDEFLIIRRLAREIAAIRLGQPLERAPELEFTNEDYDTAVAEWRRGRRPELRCLQALWDQLDAEEASATRPAAE